MSRTDRDLLRDALHHVAVLREHLNRTDLSDDTVADAVAMRLAAMIEALARTSDDLRERTFGDQWPLMWATRNRIAHGYVHVDMSIIQQTVDLDLPDIELHIRAELAEADDT